MGIESEEAPASARQGRARAYIDAGREAIGRGGVGLEEAGNNFRKAAEVMLSARVEAAGFTADDVWRWRGAKAGRVPLSAKEPSFSDYEVFARDNSLIAEGEYSRYEDVRRVGNASSHAGRRGLSGGPSEEDLRAACRSAEELLAGMAQGGPGAAPGDARKAVYLDILGSALEAKYRLQGFVDRNRSKTAGAPEDGRGPCARGWRPTSATWRPRPPWRRSTWAGSRGNGPTRPRRRCGRRCSRRSRSGSAASRGRRGSSRAGMFLIA